MKSSVLKTRITLLMFFSYYQVGINYSTTLLENKPDSFMLC